MSEYYIERSPDYLEHFGILGQKWGIRRFQNPDGSLTEEGKRRYGDILTPDQMKNMIKSYNLRTGSNKKLNKKTTFKTSHGTYDYKGRRIDTETEVSDHKSDDNASSKSIDTTKKDPSEMTDEELAAATARQKAESAYKQEYAKNHPEPPKEPEKVSFANQFMANLRDKAVNDIPAGISEGIKGYLTEYIKGLAKTDNNNNNKKEDKKEEKKTKETPKEKTKPQEKPKETPKEQPKPQEKPKEIPKEQPKEAPKEQPKSQEKPEKISNSMIASYSDRTFGEWSSSDFVPIFSSSSSNNNSYAFAEEYLNRDFKRIK